MTFARFKKLHFPSNHSCGVQFLGDVREHQFTFPLLTRKPNSSSAVFSFRKIAATVKTKVGVVDYYTQQQKPCNCQAKSNQKNLFTPCSY